MKIYPFLIVTTVLSVAALFVGLLAILHSQSHASLDDQIVAQISSQADGLSEHDFVLLNGATYRIEDPLQLGQPLKLRKRAAEQTVMFFDVNPGSLRRVLQKGGSIAFIRKTDPRYPDELAKWNM